VQSGAFERIDLDDGVDVLGGGLSRAGPWSDGELQTRQTDQQQRDPPDAPVVGCLLTAMSMEWTDVFHDRRYFGDSSCRLSMVEF